MRKLIFIKFFILIFCSCNPKIEFKKKFGLEYYYIGGAGYNNQVEFDYYYIKNIDKLISDEQNRNKLLQFAYCKFNSKNSLKSFTITSKYFEDYYDIDSHSNEEKGIVANISFVEEEGIKKPYFEFISNRSPKGKLNRMSDSLIIKTNNCVD